MTNIERKLKDLPEKPGVYIMKDRSGNIIYVGKAKILPRRVTQYFRSSPKPVKVEAMVANVADFDYIVTLSEADALVLEATLIKKHMPRYNILLKDDKGQGSYVRIDHKEEYPNIEITRHPKKDGAKYYGPFGGNITAKAMAQVIKIVYGVRTCSRKMSVKRECLDWHLGLCLAPCTKKITAIDYKQAVKKAGEFLGGKTQEAERIITEKMTTASNDMDFERAIEYRELLSMIKKLGSRTLANVNIVEADFFAYVTDGSRSAISVIPVRGNKLMGIRSYPTSDASESGDALSSFIVQYYSSAPVPSEVYLNVDMDVQPLSAVLTEKRGATATARIPIKGQKRDIIKMAEENAVECMEKSADKEDRERERTLGACDMLCKALGIPSARRIECYDISHISGTDKVASGVCFINGSKASAEYRRYRIKTVEGNDDFHCMAEVLSRRFRHAKEGDEKFVELPDLIVIDGGKGQLHSAYDVMKEAGFDLPMVGLAKREEEIFTTTSAQPIILSRDSVALKLLQRVRDEAHRFAITYHRSKRLKRINTELIKIKGIGEKKSKLLLKAYGSLDKIKQLPLEALESTAGMDKSSALAVYEYFHPTD
ncbi:MAG: excinuclease ABC subunit UvrC [Clostridia bacterium]|nr:excinuclease ABC subunit UvrC [Clostridia bacterium]